MYVSESWMMLLQSLGIPTSIKFREFVANLRLECKEGY